MKLKIQLVCRLLICSLLFSCGLKKGSKKPEFDPTPSSAYNTPEESLKTMHLPEGYHMELVASEPMIKEPVAITWDANGRMYVAEMLTYMQDADATGEQMPYSRVMLLEDANHDGVMDKSSVFIDSLLLPRMIQCVGTKLLVNETNTITISSYEDTDADGKADKKKIVYQDPTYSSNDANMEHQRSGLDWNIDNWMYVTYEGARFRYENDSIRIDKMPTGGDGQWGLTHDNYGRLFYSSAGGENPVLGFQINPVYGRLNFPDQFGPEFQEVWPIIATPDVQGGAARLRANNTLNHFTAACGQSIYRGDAFPKDFIGDYIVCEPVGRIIRRAKVSNVNGKTVLKNAYNQEEFISSSDMNFRPLNSATGPDGNLYIVDIYRGIVQQGNWTKKETFLRNKIDSLGLAKNIGRGRIYRVVHDGEKKAVQQPNMLNESPATLVKYLGHPNGWWRDNAQKLLVIKGDKSVIPALKEMATSKPGSPNDDAAHLARIHALWTLDGLYGIDQEILLHALNDPNPKVRKAAVWISESFLSKNDVEITNAVYKMKDDADYDVQTQVMLSAYHINKSKSSAVVTEMLAHQSNKEMLTAVKDAMDKRELVKNLSARLGNLPAKVKGPILSGAVTFRSTCATCHGADGKGIVTTGSSMPAPSLVGAIPLSVGNKHMAIEVILKGLKGPINGKTYPSEMPSLASNSNNWIANVLTYARYEFGGNRAKNKLDSPQVLSKEVAKIRKDLEARTAAFTIEELKRVKDTSLIALAKRESQKK
jgi:glucose/arabinose dehydrogenase/mono/diheme cytochrome c family protein